MAADDTSKLVYSTDKNVPRKEQPVKQVFQASILPGQQQVYVRLERKGRGGKTVSVIDGLTLSSQERERLLKQLKAALGTGGTIKDNALEIQGDHRDRIIELLRKIGYRPKRSGA